MNISHISNIKKGKCYFIVFSILFSTFCIGSIYSCYLGDTLRYDDEKQYIAIAKNVSEKHLFSIDGKNPTAYRPPGYPIILSLLISLGGNILHLRLFNYISLCISMFLLYAIVKNNYSAFSGILSLILTLCYPVLFYTAGTFYPQTVASSIFLFIILLFISGKRKTSIIYSFLIGLSFGLLILTVPTFIFILFIVCLWILFENTKKRFMQVLAIITGVLLLIVPWTFRNYTVFRSFVFISTNSGVNFLLGNSENTTPNGGVNVDIKKYVHATEKMNEAQRNQYYAKKAIEFIINNKSHSIKLYFLKFFNYFNFRNELATKKESSNTKNIIMLFTYGPLLLGLILRLLVIKMISLTRFEMFSILVYILNGAFSAIFFTRIRFRTPFDFILIGITSIFIATLFQRYYNSKT